MRANLFPIYYYFVWFFSLFIYFFFVRSDVQGFLKFPFNKVTLQVQPMTYIVFSVTKGYYLPVLHGSRSISSDILVGNVVLSNSSIV